MGRVAEGGELGDDAVLVEGDGDRTTTARGRSRNQQTLEFSNIILLTKEAKQTCSKT